MHEPSELNPETMSISILADGIFHRISSPKIPGRDPGRDKLKKRFRFERLSLAVELGLTTQFGCKVRVKRPTSAVEYVNNNSKKLKLKK